MTALEQPATSPPRRPTALVVVGIVLVAQVVLAAAMAFGPRPQPFGWQMYSAAPDAVRAWAVTGTGEEPIDIEALLVHGRFEIDRAALVRAHGCERSGAESVRIEHATGAVETIACR